MIGGSFRLDAIQEGLRALRVLRGCKEALAKGMKMKSAATGTGAPKAAKSLAHESAFIDEDVEIGEGTSIWHVSHVLKSSRIGKNCRIGQNVVIGPKAVVGNGVKIQNNVSVYEGVTLEDDVFCGLSMVFTNVMNPRSEVKRMHQIKPTLVRRGASLGANSTIVCGTTIGRYAFVGAGAAVTRNVPHYAVVVGNPGRRVGRMCVCGQKLRFEESARAVCADCGRSSVADADSVRLA